MKLYATVTSERATKGQGGEYIDVNLYGNDKIFLGQLCLRQRKPDEYALHLITWQGNTKDVFIFKAKGNKQKDEKCQMCGENINRPNGACPDRHFWK